ncbi:MAG: ribosome maturation factor RimP [Candidatus Rariloculaceae bacterium]
MNFSIQKKRLIDLLEPSIQGLGYELVDVEIHSNRNGCLRLYIDRDSGIGLDDCEIVSRQVSALLDVEDPISGQYELEVSSPGFERSLRTLEHFRRFVGAVVKIKLRLARKGRQNFKGLLVGVKDQDVLIEIDNETVRLTYLDIASAQLVSKH